MNRVLIMVGLWALVSFWFACDTVDKNAQSNSEPLLVVAPELRARVLEDVPIEDRHYLHDSSLIIAKASRERTENFSEAINKYIPEEPDNENRHYFLVAGSFYEESEALKLVQFLEHEELPVAVIPFENRLRVAIVLETTEDMARQKMDSLNVKYTGTLNFWFLNP